MIKKLICYNGVYYEVGEWTEMLSPSAFFSVEFLPEDICRYVNTVDDSGFTPDRVIDKNFAELIFALIEKQKKLSAHINEEKYPHDFTKSRNLFLRIATDVNSGKKYLSYDRLSDLSWCMHDTGVKKIVPIWETVYAQLTEVINHQKEIMANTRSIKKAHDDKQHLKALLEKYKGDYVLVLSTAEYAKLTFDFSHGAHRHGNKRHVIAKSKIAKRRQERKRLNNFSIDQ